MKIRRADDHAEMPWRNGQGTTWEALREPSRQEPDGGIDLRLSFARVTRPGAFSSFPGIDRVLVLIAGHGLELRVRPPGAEREEDCRVHRLRPFDSLAFPGEAQIDSVPQGATADFNVMSRRSVMSAQVEVVPEPRGLALDSGDGRLLVAVLARCASARWPGGGARLDERDVLDVGPGDPAVVIDGEGSVVAVVRARRLGS